MAERVSRREAFLQTQDPAQDTPAPVDETPSNETFEEKQSADETPSNGTVTEAPYDLTPDIKTGYYTICIKKPNPDYSTTEAETVFTQFGTVARMNFTKMFVFVMYLEKEAATNAMEALADEFEIFVPKPRTEESIQARTDQRIKEMATKTEGGQGDAPSSNGTVNKLMSKVSPGGANTQPRTTKIRNWQEHIKTNPCIYVGNLPKTMEKPEFEELFKDSGYNELMFYVKGIKRFAFVYFPTPGLCQKAQKEFSGKMVGDRQIFVNFVRDKSRARIMEGRDSRPGAPQVPSLMSQNVSDGGHSRNAGQQYGNVMVPMGHLQAANDLAFRVDGLLLGILDDSYISQRIGGLVRELGHCLNEMVEGVRSNQSNQSHHQGSSQNGGVGRGGMQGVKAGHSNPPQAGRGLQAGQNPPQAGGVQGTAGSGITLGRGRAGASY